MIGMDMYFQKAEKAMNFKRTNKAFLFAAEKHKKQKRKDEAGTPYINHPLEVASILADVGVDDVDVLIAAVLHDVIEDCGVSHAELIRLFGREVADIVEECSDDKSLSKSTRKRLQIEHAKECSIPARVVKLADKISNLESTIKSPPKDWSDLQKEGYVLWSFFVCKGLKGVIPELDDRVDNIFKFYGIHDLSIEEREKKLNAYYQLLDEIDAKKKKDDKNV